MSSSWADLLGTLHALAQAQAVVIMAGFFVAWHWAAWRRRRGRRAIERRGTASTPYCADAARPPERDAALPRAPPVTVVMPVKGVTPGTRANWEAQLESAYRGRLEFVFAVESERDPAHQLAREVIRAAEAKLVFESRGVRGRALMRADEFANRGQIDPSLRPPPRIVVAGSSETCSQKIHSMLAGFEAASEDCELVLFLDDDIRTHPCTVGALARNLLDDLGEGSAPKSGRLRRRKRCFLSNGFPFDLPAPDGPFANYLTMVYHLVLLVAFSQGTWTKNVWGGCMLLRASDLRRDAHGCVTKYRDGGYSDDLILAALCDEFGLAVGCPSEAIFPQELRERQSLREWWNYLRRQLFVMDTYASPRNKAINRGMLYALAYLSLAATYALLAALIVLFAWAWSECARAILAAEAFAAEMGASELAPRGGIWRVFPRPETVVGFANAVADATSFSAPPRAALASLASLTSFVLALTAARRMYRETGAMAGALGDEAARRAVGKIRWTRVACAFLVAYALVPVAAGVTLAKSDVTWAGVAYRKRDGRVARVKTRR